MSDAGSFLLVFVAIGIGWLLGRFGGFRKQRQNAENVPPGVYKGLNYLLSEKTDQGIEAFVESLEVSDATLDTHVALGKLMRSRGEVDKAIRIHLNLIGQSGLSRHQQHTAHLELARDYQHAGVLDRAESLLQDLVQQSPILRNKALTLLTDIYDEEKDWQQALAVGQKILPGANGPGSSGYGPAEARMANRLAHYCCELANGALAEGDTRAALAHITRAQQFDPLCVRAGLLEAEILERQDEPQKAIQVLEGITERHPTFIAPVLPALRRNYSRAGDLPGLYRYLEKFLDHRKSTAAVLCLVDALYEKGDVQQAGQLLASELQQHPTLLGMKRLLEISLESPIDDARRNLLGLQDVARRAREHKPAYRCDRCGFSGRQLHWQCPNCKNWGSVAPILGIDGD